MRRLFIFFTVILYLFVGHSFLSAQELRVAVTPFKAQGVGRAFARNVGETIRKQMIDNGRVSVIERSRVIENLKKLGLEKKGCFALKCAVKIGELIPADRVIFGTVFRERGKNVYTVSTVDVEKETIEVSKKQNITNINNLKAVTSGFTDKLINNIIKTSAAKVKPGKLKDDYFPDFEVDQDMKAAPTVNSFNTRGIQYGGWITPVLIDQRIGAQTLTTSITTLRLWVKSYLWDNSFIYIRGKEEFLKIITQEGFDLDETDNLIDLDLAFIEMTTGKRNVKFAIGRKFFLLGTGLLLNGRGDGVEFGYYSRLVNVRVFGSYTGLLLKDNNPYGLSDKDLSDGSKRIFAGGDISKEFSNQTAYLMGMAQIDQGDEAAGEKTRYQSQYYGAGLKGVVLENLSYQGEFFYETGKSYLSGLTEKKSIKAYAGVFNLYYFFKANMNPALIAQYAYGSGDEDRSDYRSPTGNAAKDDQGFLSFGTYVGGYALRPILANMHVIRGGFTFTPFSWSRVREFNRMSLISKYSYYMKDKKDSPINFGEATEAKKFIGHGVDVSLRWKIYHDFSLFITYALFLPGDAFSTIEDDNRNFILSGLNISF